MPGFTSDVDRLRAEIEQQLPRPQFSLTGVSPAPTNMLVPAGGFLDLPVFAIKLDDRSNVDILSAGAYFRVTGDILNTSGTVRLATFLDLRLEDTSGAGGNVTWTINAISGTDLGTGSEVIFEDTLYFASVSSNLRIMQFGSSELFEIPGLSIAEFGARASHNAGADRMVSLLSLEAGFQQQAVT